MPSTIPLDPDGSTAGRKHLDGKKPRPKTVTVDFHNHMEIPAASDFISNRPFSGHLRAKAYKVLPFLL